MTVVESKTTHNLPESEQAKYLPPGIKLCKLASLEGTRVGQTAHIIGAGPSLARVDQKSILAAPNSVSIAINSAACWGPADYACMIDRPNWALIKDQCKVQHLVAPTIYGWYLHQDNAWDAAAISHTWTFAETTAFGYPDAPSGRIFKGPKLWRERTLYMAISLAIILGCTAFELIGVDLNGDTHWDGSSGTGNPQKRWRSEREAITWLGYFLRMSGYELGTNWAKRCPLPIVYQEPTCKVTKVLSV